MTKSRIQSSPPAPSATVDKVIAKNTALYRDWLLHRFPGYSIVERDLQITIESEAHSEPEAVFIKR